MLKFFLFFSFTIVSMEATSLRLYNESSCPLKAIIEGADGSILSEVIVEGHSQCMWNEGTRAQIPLQAPKKSQTPLTVHWQCLSGEAFGILEGLSTGALAATGRSSGLKNCSEPKKGEER